MTSPVLRLSAEGIPLRDYRSFHVLLALVPAILLWIIGEILAWTIREPSDALPEFPPNTLILGFHRELGYLMCSQALWKQLGPDKPIYWIGIHHWASYWGSFGLWLKGAKCFRYTPATAKRPLQQIIDYLRENPGPCFIRTDAGGPYDVVKKSAVKLAVQSQRDLVCFRQTADQKIRTLKGHLFPLPFTTVRTYLSAPIRWQELASLSEEEARAWIQREMENTITKTS